MYATRTGFEKEYHGVTIGDTGSLEAGVISLNELEDYAEYDLTEDKTTLADEGKIIYWFQNIIENRTLNYILSSNGSSTNILHPVTTASDDVVDYADFHLIRAPRAFDDYTLDSSSYAETEDYIHLPLVFRYEEEKMSGEYVSNAEIYFSECKAETSEDNPDREVYKAIRLFANNGTDGYILNPSADADGNNKVGGILDLNNDGFYDYDWEGYEHIYGETESFSYNPEVTPIDGSLPAEERTTFVSNHKKDIYALNEETFVSKVVSYKCMNKFINRTIPITVTRADYHNLALLDFYVYAEGWDLHVIDEELDSKFNLFVAFEVNE